MLILGQGLLRINLLHYCNTCTVPKRSFTQTLTELDFAHLGTGHYFSIMEMKENRRHMEHSHQESCTAVMSLWFCEL